MNHQDIQISYLDLFVVQSLYSISQNGPHFEGDYVADTSVLFHAGVLLVVARLGFDVRNEGNEDLDE